MCEFVCVCVCVCVGVGSGCVWVRARVCVCANPVPPPHPNPIPCAPRAPPQKGAAIGQVVGADPTKLLASIKANATAPVPA
jgi:hypothetical protein